MPETAQRPGQATFAGWLIIGGSAVLVLVAWQRIASLHTLEVQEELQRVLSEPPFESWGISSGQLETTIRVLCMVGAAAATASAILGWHALRRSTSARLALTILTPFLLVGGFATASGFSSALVMMGIAMLWLRPTRDWFAGRAWAAPTAALAQRRADPFAPQPRPEVDGDTRPAPETPAPAAPPPPVEQPPPFRGEYGAPLPPADVPGAPESPYGVRAKRPSALVLACVIVWASGAIVSGFMVLFSLVMAVARDEFFEEVERQQPDFDMQGLSHAELAISIYVATAFIVLWCVAAIVLAVLAFRRVAWARVALVVCAGVAGLVLLGATFLSPPLAVLLAADVITVWLLLRADVAAWFTR